jgi:hypothetical protein
MIRYNLYLVIVLPNKKIEKLKYFTDFSIYYNIDRLHEHISTIVGKDILENYNIFYFYNGKMLREKIEIELFDKTIVAYLVPKTKNISNGFDILNNSIQNLFNRIMGIESFDSDDYREEPDNDEIAVNEVNIDLDAIFNMYQEQFLSMIGMGFSDEFRVSIALQVTGGNIDHAINYYLSNA